MGWEGVGMDETLFAGLIGIGIGLVVALAGYGVFRVLLVLSGVLGGFSLGWALALTWQAAPLVGFLLGVAGAVLLGWLAFTFYQIAVYVGLGFLGFAVGAGAMGMFGVTQAWIVLTVGLLVAVVLVVVGIAADLVTVLIVVSTAISGSQLTIGGALVLTGDRAAQDLTVNGLTEPIPAWGWVAMIALAVVGIVVQWRAVGASRVAQARSRAAGSGAAGSGVESTRVG